LPCKLVFDSGSLDRGSGAGFVVRRSRQAIVLLATAVMQTMCQAAVLGVYQGQQVQEFLGGEEGRMTKARQFVLPRVKKPGSLRFAIKAFVKWRSSMRRRSYEERKSKSGRIRQRRDGLLHRSKTKLQSCTKIAPAWSCSSKMLSKQKLRLKHRSQSYRVQTEI